MTKLACDVGSTKWPDFAHLTKPDLAHLSVADGRVKMCRYEIIIIKPDGRLFIVASVYRPPDSSWKCSESFEYVIKAVDNENKK